MTVVTTAIDREGEGFRANETHNRTLAEELRSRVAEASLGGSQQHRDRHVARGKLLPRDRIPRLLEPGSPFLEIGQLAANGMYGSRPAASGVTPGLGRIRRRAGTNVANDTTLKDDA